ncbi:hypothetical protein HUK80_01985 [Flavobacterium sp. MAH-1]|uniref:DUF6438 domain-containing protein n=1 Tax=Flavobacterium agri TaxID=2743471 RepID=A0A7Y9C498_9FLAO|nr:DUF6438 domain-containing protein [Flavobacterium agri]NUY79650.1 hypothetical protein [Flavobacterium agri]NYA69675.1 hypothetical protein [Flavobacterium agri]
MKIIKILLILLIFSSCKNRTEYVRTKIILSEIDNLKSKSEIEKFIQKSDTNYRSYELKNLQDFDRGFGGDSLNKILANKLNVKINYKKVDFDNNGYTDLLAIGDNHTCYGEAEKSCSFSPIVIMNYGKNKTKVFNIDLDRGKAIVPKVEFVDTQPFLVIYQNKLTDWQKKTYSVSKTILTFKFGDFIEYNANPKSNKITKIEFETSGCFGTCPVYNLTLNRDSLSTFDARHYNFNKNREIAYEKQEGVFTTSINKMEFDKLEEILNYCDFENLSSEYSVMHTDDQTGNLKVIFNNGKVKTVHDYGMIGTNGLKILYEKLAELRFNQKWRKK